MSQPILLFLLVIACPIPAWAQKQLWCREFQFLLAQKELEMRLEQPPEPVLLGNPVGATIVFRNKGARDIQIPQLEPWDATIAASATNAKTVLPVVSGGPIEYNSWRSCQFPTRTLRSGEEYRVFREPILADPMSDSYPKIPPSDPQVLQEGRYVQYLELGSFRVQGIVEWKTGIHRSGVCVAPPSVVDEMKYTTPCVSIALVEMGNRFYLMSQLAPHPFLDRGYSVADPQTNGQPAMYLPWGRWFQLGVFDELPALEPLNSRAPVRFQDFRVRLGNKFYSWYDLWNGMVESRKLTMVKKRSSVQ